MPLCVTLSGMTSAPAGLVNAIAIGALLLLAVNIVASDAVLGARNWLEIGGFSFQPSELVKVAYVYVGAATLEKLFRRRNLFGFIAFSAICVMALALIARASVIYLNARRPVPEPG